jgi:hypothetical protein
LVLRFGRIDSPISFCFLFYHTETSRQTGGLAVGMALLGRTVRGRKLCGVFLHCLVVSLCSGYNFVRSRGRRRLRVLFSHLALWLGGCSSGHGGAYCWLGG